MSAYEELVERCARAICNDEPRLPWNEASAEDCRKASRAVLAEVLRTLETVTPEMEREMEPPMNVQDWRVVLHASPITTP